MKNCFYFNPVYMHTKCGECSDHVGITCWNCDRCSTCHGKQHFLVRLVSWFLG